VHGPSDTRQHRPGHSIAPLKKNPLLPSLPAPQIAAQRGKGKVAFPLHLPLYLSRLTVLLILPVSVGCMIGNHRQDTAAPLLFY
jgi:hypothetical protein